MTQIIAFRGVTPKIHHSVYIASGSVIIGDVEIEQGSSIWPNCVIRGDVAKIRIGKKTNIQDGSVIHVSRNGGDTIIGDEVTIGHMVLLHACNIANRAFIGMGSIIMDKATIESEAYVAAGALVTNNKIVKSDQLWAGQPAKLMRAITEEERKYMKISADNYCELAQEYILDRHCE